MENLSLSVPDLLTTVKQFVDAEKHPQLDQMLQRYLNKELGKQQVCVAQGLGNGRRTQSDVCPPTCLASLHWKGGGGGGGGGWGWGGGGGGRVRVGVARGMCGRGWVEAGEE